MNVLMISTDKGLVGDAPLGDVVERHRAYGEQPGVERLDIVVFSLKGTVEREISPKVHAYPTASVSKLLYLTDAIKVCERLFGQHAYDVVVTQDPFVVGLVGAHMKRKHGGKLLVHFHGDYFDNPIWKSESRLNAMLLKFGNSIINQADGLRVVSSGIAEKLVKRGIPSERIRVIPTPVDVAKFQHTSSEQITQFRETYRLGEEKVVLNVGRNDTAKDFPTLYHALREVCERFSGRVRFMQIGAGLSADEISKQISAPSERISITATGKVPHDELIAAYHLADVYVSSSSHESLGKVLMEANAAGLPVVATATTGSQEIIEPGVNGYLVPVGDTRALAEKIIHLLENPDLAKIMGERGRARMAERFDGKKNIAAVVQYWSDLTTK